MASFEYVIYENTNGSRGRDLATLLDSRVRQHACATMEERRRCLGAEEMRRLGLARAVW